MVSTKEAANARDELNGAGHALLPVSKPNVGGVIPARLLKGRSP
jgi:hypothetical protein